MIEFLIALVVAAISVGGVVLGRLASEVAGLRAENRRLWVWARGLVDYAYRYRREGSPDLPPLPDLDDD